MITQLYANVILSSLAVEFVVPIELVATLQSMQIKPEVTFKYEEDVLTIVNMRESDVLFRHIF